MPLGLGNGMGLGLTNVAATGGGGAPTSYRALRLRPSASGGAAGIAVAEMSIWAGGSNVTSGATVSATQTTFGAAADAVDGNLSTFWGTSFDSNFTAPSKDFIFDLGATSSNWKLFDKLRITARAGGNNTQAPASFTIDVTTGDPAGSPTWTTVKTVSGQAYDTVQTPVDFTF